MVSNVEFGLWSDFLLLRNQYCFLLIVMYILRVYQQDFAKTAIYYQITDNYRIL